MSKTPARGSQRMFPVEANVRFTQDWLLQATPAERKRYENRIGTVTGYRMGADHPIVHFPAIGRRVEQRLFEVWSSHLELVVSSGQPAQETNPPRYFHPQASHVTPDFRDGWNAALKAAGVPPSPEWK